MDVVDIIDSDSNDEEHKNKKEEIHEPPRTARKSTVPKPNAIETRQAITRRQAITTRNNQVETLNNSNERFMQNFNPDTSIRERRKLRKVTQSIQNTAPRKINNCVYDENGVHIASGLNVCDCLNTSCVGCFFPCPKCKSTKCGVQCRVNRKYVYEQIEYQGCDIIEKNPLL